MGSPGSMRPTCSQSFALGPLICLCARIKNQGHASKNAGGQICSPIRTIYMGQYFVDTAAAFLQGMPPAAFCREERSSVS